jgi:hypothetical protein
MITPFLSSWWPTLLLSSEREGVVEKFRTSRITGLVGDITYAATWTNTPTTTGTATTTSTPTNTSTNTATSTPTATVCPTSGTGLLGEYFFNQDLTSVKHYQVDPTVNFNWGGSPMAGMPATNFSVRWLGWIQAPYTGTYTFTTKTDDGSRLWVNNSLVVDWWNDQGATNRSGTISLNACTIYPIKMEYYQNTGGDSAILKWTVPGSSSVVIPSTNLYPANATGTPTVTFMPTITPSFTPTNSLTPTKTLTPTITWTASITPIPSITPTPTKSLTPLPPTNTLPPTQTSPPTDTFTPKPTKTKTPSPMPTITPSNTVSPTITKTPTPKPSPTACRTPIEMGGCH